MSHRLHRLRVILGLGLALASTSCDDKVTYSFFNVSVKLDRTTIDDELLGLIEACGAVAETPVRMDTADLRCVRGRIPDSLGIFEYATTLTTGSVKFTVLMTSYFGTPVASGEVGPVGIVPGQTMNTEVLVKGIPDAPRSPPVSPGSPPDAAAPDAGAPDSAPDVSTTDSAPSDAPDAAAADAAPDLPPDAAPDLEPDAGPDAATD